MSLEERQKWRDAQRTAVYRLFDGDGVLLYVGITYDVPERWRHHRRHKPWWPQVAHKQLTWFATRLEAEAAEEHAIVAGDPLHNTAKNWPSYKAEYRIRWLGARLKEERAALCTPRRPRAKAKVARLAEVEGNLRRLEDHAPQHWGHWDWDKKRALRELLEGRSPRYLAYGGGTPRTVEEFVQVGRFENGECPTCGVPVLCPVVKVMGQQYRDHPMYCL